MKKHQNKIKEKQKSDKSALLRHFTRHKIRNEKVDK